MSPSEDDDAAADSGDRLLMLLLESSDPAVGDLARRLLTGMGFTVEFARADSPASLELDHRAARYAVVVVADGSPAVGGSADGVPGDGGPAGRGAIEEPLNARPAPRAGGINLFAAVFQGVDVPKVEGAIYVQPDDLGRWTDQLAEILVQLGWVVLG